jgi:hypothetical protein
MRVRALHAYARSHILGRTLSIRGATFYVRTFLYVFVPNLVETFLCMGYMICTCVLAFAHYMCTMHALLACLYCMHVCILTFWDGFPPNLVKTFIICPALNGHWLVYFEQNIISFREKLYKKKKSRTLVFFILRNFRRQKRYIKDFVSCRNTIKFGSFWTYHPVLEWQLPNVLAQFFAAAVYASIVGCICTYKKSTAKYDLVLKNCV